MSDAPRERNEKRDRSINIGFHIGPPRIGNNGQILIPGFPKVEVGQDQCEQINWPSVGDMNGKIRRAWERNKAVRERRGLSVQACPSVERGSASECVKISRKEIEKGVSLGLDLRTETLGLCITDRETSCTEFYAPVYFAKALKIIADLERDTDALE